MQGKCIATNHLLLQAYCGPTTDQALRLLMERNSHVRFLVTQPSLDLRAQYHRRATPLPQALHHIGQALPVGNR